MLKRGIRPEVMEVVAGSLTDREVFEAELKQRAEILAAELRREAGLGETPMDHPVKQEEVGQENSRLVKLEMVDEDVKESPSEVHPEDLKRHRSESMKRHAASTDPLSSAGALDQI